MLEMFTPSIISGLPAPECRRFCSMCPGLIAIAACHVSNPYPSWKIFLTKVDNRQRLLLLVRRLTPFRHRAHVFVDVRHLQRYAVDSVHRVAWIATRLA